jgi:isocitrate/isopropylmalate dehydrogenase
MPHRITLIPGDVARPEISEATVRVLQATGVQFEGGDPAIGQIAEIDGQGRVTRISGDSDFASKMMSGRSHRPCAETHSRERQ